MASLGQTLRCQNREEKNSARTLEFFYAKTARKKHSRNKAILKIGHLTKAIAHANAIAFAQRPVCFKN